jgi:hypothetical protein
MQRFMKTQLLELLFRLRGGWSAPEKLDVQVLDMERGLPFEFLTSLLRRRGGWFANHALQRTRRERRGCNPRIPWAGSLSLGRWAAYTARGTGANI